ncbi:unnamed protein product [Gongylonema pulchrum]|uniref:Uncharacterized protein n=1 Tax=Gongylonema pulchrum TaxID=637853 RepID=A0A183DDC0_9BILA|nr:unnamed protein product [Gongylonema pulchrum]
MSDKEGLERGLEEGCKSYFWYFVASFGYTVFIVLAILIYLTMYSDHFMWALRRKPKLVRVQIFLQFID